MDSVPFVFYEDVVFLFDDCRQLSKLSKIGTVDFRKICASRKFRVFNGELVDDYFCYGVENMGAFRVAAPRKHCRTVLIRIYANAEVYQTDPLVLRRIRAYSQGKEVVLHLLTTNPSQEIASFLDKISVTTLVLHTDHLSNVQPMLKLMPILKKILQKKALYEIKIYGGDYNDLIFGNFLLELLKQEQFERASLPVLNGTFFEALFVQWHENPSKMVGKRLIFEDFVGSVDHGQMGFVDAQNELDFLKLYYPLILKEFPVKWLDRALFTQSQNGSRMFWLTEGKECALAFL